MLAHAVASLPWWGWLWTCCSALGPGIQTDNMRLQNQTSGSRSTGDIHCHVTNSSDGKCLTSLKSDFWRVFKGQFKPGVTFDLIYCQTSESDRPQDRSAIRFAHKSQRTSTNLHKCEPVINLLFIPTTQGLLYQLSKTPFILHLFQL